MESIDARLKAQDNTLQIGGMLYFRSDLSITDGERMDDHTLNMPNLVDLYLDARPNDRVRAFMRGRLSWNPSIDGEEEFGMYGVRERTRVDLTELWLRFDMKRTVFVTIGQAHIRWGATRIWNPVDVINSTRRTPLALFDARNGVPQIKLHMPIERLGWNFYALAMTDSVKHLDTFGVAGRGEFVFSTVELGLTGAYRKHTDPKAGLDISAGVGDVDITGEVGLTFEEETPTIQASGGLQYGIRYGDKDVMYLGVEYFYNQGGYNSINDALLSIGTDLAVFNEDPGEVLSGLQPFYIGKHYAAAFVLFPGLGDNDDTSVNLSAITNLSDRSAVVRCDWGTKILTHLSLETYAQVHVGEPGELKFGGDALDDWIEIPIAQSMSPDTYTIPNSVAEVGVNLRMNF